MSDEEIFGPEAVARRLVTLEEYETPDQGLSDAELLAVAATCEANGISFAFDGTYPHPGGEKRSGWINPPPPGGGP